MNSFFRKLKWRARRRSEAELDEELQFHLDEEAEDRQADGLTKEEARWAARRDLGSLALVRENTRAVWTWALAEQLAQDLRYALRTMAANKVFSTLAVLSLALGIGANTAIYSFMDAILMRALPVPDSASLVVINWRSTEWPAVARSFWGSNWRDPKLGLVSGNFPFPAYELLRSEDSVFSSLFAFSSGAGRLNVQIQGQADLAITQYVTGRFFSGVGVPPAAGRLIDDTDDRPGAPPVAVVSFGYAQKRFGEAAKAAGQAILINNTPFTIIGVTAPDFFGVDPSDNQDIYLPMRTSALLDNPHGPALQAKYVDNNLYWVQMMGRLRAGVTLAQAQAALAPVFHEWVASTASNDKERADLPALWLREGAAGLDRLRRQFSKPLQFLMAMVGLILTIACANLANLLLARAAARRREIAVRLGLGASRLRVVRQLLTESVLLSCVGGLLGVLFARWGIGALTALIANGREDFTLHAELNWHVLGMACALSLITGMLFGLAPALQATRVDLSCALKQTGAGGQRARFRASFLRAGLSQALVVSQIAISVLLLVAAGLFVRTLSNLHSVQLGFNREDLLLFTVNARQAGYTEDGLARFYQNLHSRLSSVPGVRGISESNYALVSGSMYRTNVIIPGAAPGKHRGVAHMSIGPSFLATMQIPILLGRDISERDVEAGAKVAVVNERFVKTYFEGVNPLGRHFGLGGGKNVTDLEIVGVARNAQYSSLKQDIPELAYIPYSQNPRDLNRMTYELRTAGDPLALTKTVRQILHEADARIPPSDVMTQARVIEQTIDQERTVAALCSCFAFLAVLIACVGLYGVMAYNVARRTGEIGLRMALGAQRRRLLWMVLREVIVLCVAGLSIGLPVALATSRIVRTFLFGMKPNDPLTVSAAALVLLAAAVLAGYGPAWRASRIDPWTALRHE